MLFNVYLKNHHLTGVGSLEDIIRPIAAGLVEGGHQIQFEYGKLMPRPWVNLLFEYFPDLNLISELRGAKARLGDDLLLGLIGTEDLADTISMGEVGDQRRLDHLRQVFTTFDFIWTIVPPEEYNRILDGRMTAHFLPFGHCPALERAAAEHRTLDVLLYGKLNRYRAPVVHDLITRGVEVQGTFGDMPEYLRYNMISRSTMVLDMRRGTVVRYMSPSRICAAIHNGSLVVAEDFDRTRLAPLYRYTVAIPLAELADTCAALAADPGHAAALAGEKRGLFAAETSMRANIEALLPTIPG
jgi:hypothetical protein